MIAADTSSLRRFLAGERGPDVEAIADALRNRAAVLPPVVVTELLSDPHAAAQLSEVFSGIPLLEIKEGYWVRAGRLRAEVLAAGYKARVADALVAQSCLDHRVALITFDRDFRHFAAHGLVLV